MEVIRDTFQLTVFQQIWDYLQEIVATIVQLLEVLDMGIYEVVDINKSERLALICEFYNLKSAS